MDYLKYKEKGWKDIDDSVKDGRYLLLVVKNSLVPLQDVVEYSTTIGFNAKQETGEDTWFLVGWSWTADEFLQDTSTNKVLLYKNIPELNGEECDA